MENENFKVCFLKKLLYKTTNNKRKEYTITDNTYMTKFIIGENMHDDEFCIDEVYHVPSTWNKAYFVIVEYEKELADGKMTGLKKSFGPFETYEEAENMDEQAQFASSNVHLTNLTSTDVAVVTLQKCK